jgi:hypothetical protein
MPKRGKDNLIPFPTPKDLPGPSDSDDGFETIDLPTLSERIYRLYAVAAVSIDPKALSPDSLSHFQLAMGALIASHLHINTILDLPPLPSVIHDDAQPTEPDASLDLSAFRERIMDLDFASGIVDQGDLSRGALSHLMLGTNSLWTARIHIEMASRSEAASSR